MAPLLQLLLALVSMVTLARGNLQYLYYTAPGGAAYGELQGFYGAAASYKDGEDALDYPDSGVQCLDTKNGLQKGFELRSISMDPKSRKVMLSVKHPFDTQVTLATINLCLPQEDCGNATFTPHLVFDNAQLKYPMSPIAYYDSTVYFLVTKEKESGGRTTRTIELRMLHGCNSKYPVTVYTSFYLMDCSKEIAKVAEAEFESVSPIYVANNLYVINTGSESFFLTQLQKVEYDEQLTATSYKMELVMIKNSTGEVISLHEESLDTKFRVYELYQLGAIDLKDGKLCWSAVDTILCADWSNSGSISNIVTVLPKGDSLKACLTMPGDEMAELLVTGIAVAKSEGEFAIYFGCLAQTSGYGGAGLVRMKDEKRDIFSMKVNATDIYAGSMFLVSDCRPEKTSPVEGGGGGYGISAASQITAHAFTFLVLHMLMKI